MAEHVLLEVPIVQEQRTFNYCQTMGFASSSVVVSIISNPELPANDNYTCSMILIIHHHTIL